MRYLAVIGIFVGVPFAYIVAKTEAEAKEQDAAAAAVPEQGAPFGDVPQARESSSNNNSKRNSSERVLDSDLDNDSGMLFGDTNDYNYNDEDALDVNDNAENVDVFNFEDDY